jgi:hypothetical protein
MLFLLSWWLIGLKAVELYIPSASLSAAALTSTYMITMPALLRLPTAPQSF